MAQVTMTDAQKELLLNDTTFQVQVKWSILDQAAYTRGDNGVNKADATSAKNWALWRSHAARIIENPNAFIGYNDYLFFVNQISTQALPCWDNVANTTTAAVQWLISNNHFGANDLAQAWFTEKTYQNPF